jgi:hypothetical protein
VQVGPSDAERAAGFNGGRGYDGEGRMCVSIAVTKLVWAYGPNSRNARLLLLAIAEHANDDGIAWPGLGLLAEETRQSERTVQRLVAVLEREGWLQVQRRTNSVPTRGGQYERRGNTYHVSLAKLRGELPTRQTEDRAAAGADVHRSGAVNNARRDDKTEELRRQNEHPETTKTAPRDDKTRAPLMNHKEPPMNRHEPNQPLPLPLGEECAKSKSAKTGEKQRTTASANASAKTLPPAAAVTSTESVGEASLSSGPGFLVGGNVIPFSRRTRRAADPRDGMDAPAALLFGVTMDVLGECGVAEKNVTRRQRVTVCEALRDEVARSERPLAMVAAGAITRWDEYQDAAREGFLWRVVGVRQFFAEGYWLEAAGHPWDWDKAALAECKRRAGAGVGQYRG